MMKNILLAVSALAFFMFKAFSPEGIKLTPKAPQSVNPGEEFVYELTVSKPGISGFAKIQQELPAGVTAEQIESKSATFKYDNGIIKLIWMSLPAENEFTISYKIKVDATAQGNIKIGGKFSFLENNEKRTEDIPSIEINISSTATAPTASAPETPAATSSETPATTPTMAATETETPTTQATTAVSGGSDVTGTRTITEISTGKYKVSISIANPGLTGFAKAQDILPAGAMGYEDTPNGAVFTAGASKAKFVWMSVPTDKEIKVSYILATNNPEDLKNITGEFSYLDNNETRKAPIVTLATTAALASNTTAPAATTSTPTVTTPVAPETTPTEVISTPPATVAATTPSTPPASSNNQTTASTEPKAKTTPKVVETPIPAAQTGIGYRVQVLAGKKTISDVKSYVSSTYKFSEENVYTENIDGWIKYTIGAFTTYKSARDRRNEVTSKYTFPGPFVTAYKNGTRITVQEALMSSKEPWVQ